MPSHSPRPLAGAISRRRRGARSIRDSFGTTFAPRKRKRRLLDGESLVPDALQSAWSIGYGYNGLGQVAAETLPGNVTVTYAVNALGQTTGVTASVGGGAAMTLASGASYHRNKGDGGN